MSPWSESLIVANGDHQKKPGTSRAKRRIAAKASLLTRRAVKATGRHIGTVLKRSAKKR